MGMKVRDAIKRDKDDIVTGVNERNRKKKRRKVAKAGWYDLPQG
jgi:hypothetical protein